MTPDELKQACDVADAAFQKGGIDLRTVTVGFRTERGRNALVACECTRDITERDVVIEVYITKAEEHELD